MRDDYGISGACFYFYRSMKGNYFNAREWGRSTSKVSQNC